MPAEAGIGEIKRGMLVRRLTGFHVVVDIGTVEQHAIRLRLDDGNAITHGVTGLVEVAREAICALALLGRFTPVRIR